jgi:ATP-binding cassette subfamily B protein
MVIASFAEVASLGILVPFLGVMTSPESLFVKPKFQPFIEIFHIHSASNLMILVTTLFCLAVLISGIARMGLLWATTKISYGLGADLSMSIYRRTLYQPYLTHVCRNSSELVASISTKIGGVILHIINPILIAISSSIIMLSILLLLILLSPGVTIIGFSGFAITYLVIIKISKSRLTENSKQISIKTTEVIKYVQESLGGIRDVLLSGVQEVYCDNYKNSDNALRRAQASNYFIGNSPRFIVESAGMVLIALIALYLTKNEKNSSATIITLGVFALGAQRLLPVLQQIYYSLITIKGNEAVLKDVVILLNQSLPQQTDQNKQRNKALSRVPFNKDIVLSNITFRYSKALPTIFHRLNIRIHKGSRVGFIGQTGSGKSTLIDILMGLLKPTTGELLVDSQKVTYGNVSAWQNKIAHVSQMIHLVDASIAENIAFGIKVAEIDMKRVKFAAKQAQIDKVIESWSQGYQTLVGERGVRLSGGQRQRIAIARALYRKADVIVFDEATSALDEKTESSLMDAIQELSSELTIIIITHRISTLKYCNQIFELSNGVVRKISTGTELFSSN